VVRAAIDGVEPARLVARAYAATDVQRLLRSAAEVDVFAVGKAAGPMLSGLDRCMARRWRAALAVAPESAPRVSLDADWMVAAHPVPDARSERAGLEVLARAARLGSEDLLLVLISGGASSLAAVPAEGLSLEDKRTAQTILLLAGADIGEMNTVRKHLSRIKGGRLAAASKARVLTLAISDVVGDDLSTIGSGPTVPDPTTFDDALSVLERRGGVGRYPEAVVTYLRRGASGAAAETPKVVDATRTHARVIGSLGDALDAAETEARALGYRVHRVREPIVGEARAAGARVLEYVTRIASQGRPCCVISGGETTVRVSGAGKGGRNQEVALSMVRGLEGTAPSMAASIGTDGVDGPTDAAGALVDSTTATRARACGLDPEQYLDDNNSYEFFDALGDLVRTGATGTNVGDIQIVMMGTESATRT